MKCPFNFACQKCLKKMPQKHWSFSKHDSSFLVYLFHLVWLYLFLFKKENTPRKCRRKRNNKGEIFSVDFRKYLKELYWICDDFLIVCVNVTKTKIMQNISWATSFRKYWFKWGRLLWEGSGIVFYKHVPSSTFLAQFTW